MSWSHCHFLQHPWSPSFLHVCHKLKAVGKKRLRWKHIHLTKQQSTLSGDHMSRKAGFFPHLKKKKSWTWKTPLICSIALQEENHTLSASQSEKEGSPWLRLWASLWPFQWFSKLVFAELREQLLRGSAMSYSQWTHVHSLKQQIGTKKMEPGIVHIKLWSLIHWEEVVLEIMEHEKKCYPACLWVLTISFVFDERRRMQREKERGRWGKERERCLSTWFNRHSLEIVKDEEVCLQKMQMGRSSGSKSSSWAVLRNLQCQQLPCTALLESPGNSYGWSSLAPGKVLPRGEGQILGEADPLGR